MACLQTGGGETIAVVQRHLKKPDGNFPAGFYFNVLIVHSEFIKTAPGCLYNNISCKVQHQALALFQDPN